MSFSSISLEMWILHWEQTYRLKLTNMWSEKSIMRTGDMVSMCVINVWCCIYRAIFLWIIFYGPLNKCSRWSMILTCIEKNIDAKYIGLIHIAQSMNIFIIYLIFCHNWNHARKTASFNNVLYLIHFDGKWNLFHGFLIHMAKVWVKLKIDRCYQPCSLFVSIIL